MSLGLLLFTCIVDSGSVAAYWSLESSTLSIRQGNNITRSTVTRGSELLDVAAGGTFYTAETQSGVVRFFVSNSANPSSIQFAGVQNSCRNRATTNAVALSDVTSFQSEATLPSTLERAFTCHYLSSSGEQSSIALLYTSDDNKRVTLLRNELAAAVRAVNGATALPQNGSLRVYKFDFRGGRNLILNFVTDDLGESRLASVVIDSQTAICTSSSDIDYTVLDRAVLGR